LLGDVRRDFGNDDLPLVIGIGILTHLGLIQIFGSDNVPFKEGVLLIDDLLESFFAVYIEAT
jgi:hypothetical protein